MRGNDPHFSQRLPHLPATPSLAKYSLIHPATTSTPRIPHFTPKLPFCQGVPYPKTETRNLTTETQNPKPETWQLKPKTQNPKPDNWNLIADRW